MNWSMLSAEELEEADYYRTCEECVAKDWDLSGEGKGEITGPMAEQYIQDRCTFSIFAK
jgi:hypothetical protein